MKANFFTIFFKIGHRLLEWMYWVDVVSINNLNALRRERRACGDEQEASGREE
jgi:hypothetical protein